MDSGGYKFCGRGPGREECGTGFYCEIHPSDRYAICFPGMLLRDSVYLVVGHCVMDRLLKSFVCFGFSSYLSGCTFEMIIFYNAISCIAFSWLTKLRDP